jgi:hypothetical protein
VRLLERRKQAEAALADVRHRKRVWMRSTRSVRAWSARHRASVIVGSGIAAGLATSLLPIAALMRLLSAFAGAASLMLEGPFLRLLAAQRHDPAPAERAPSATAPR